MQNAVRGILGIEPFAYTCAKVDTLTARLFVIILMEDLIEAIF